MNTLLMHCLVICPLVFLGGFIDSVAGGGGLITLPAYMMAGIPAHIAMGTNKVVNATGTATAAVRFFRSGKIRLRAAFIAAGCALVGSAAGTRLVLAIPENVIKMMMLVLLPAIAIFLSLKRDLGMNPAGPPPAPKKEALISALIGLGIGVYDGIVGPGTGTLLIMAFTMFLSHDLITASGSAKVVNLASNIASAVVFISSAKVYWAIFLPAAACSIVGGYIGARYAIAGGAKKVRGMIFVVLGLMFVKMIWDLVV